MVSPEAGWYADPTDPSAVRWWDGAAWSAQTRPAPRELALAGAAVGASSASVGASAVPDPRTRAQPDACPGRLAPDPCPVVAVGADPCETASRSPAGRHVAAPTRRAAPAAAHETAMPEAPGVVDRSRPGARPPVTTAPEHVAPHVDPVSPADETAGRPVASRCTTPRDPAARRARRGGHASGRGRADPARRDRGSRPRRSRRPPGSTRTSRPRPRAAASGFGAAPAALRRLLPDGRAGQAARVRPMHWKIPVTIGVVIVARPRCRRGRRRAPLLRQQGAGAGCARPRRPHPHRPEDAVGPAQGRAARA